MKACAKMCPACPISDKSLQGYTGPHEPKVFVEFLAAEVKYACHSSLEIDNPKIYAGYLQMAKKSAKCFANEAMQQAMEDMQLEDNSMPLWDFLEHHATK